MVKVDPPEDWPPPGEGSLSAGAHRSADTPVVPAPSSSNAETANSLVGNTFDDALELLAGKPVPAAKTTIDPTQSGVLKTAHRSSGEHASARPVPPEPNNVPPEPNHAQPAPDAASPPPLPSASWQSEATRKRLLLGSSAAVTLLFCFAAFSVVRAMLTSDETSQRIASTEKDDSNSPEHSQEKVPVEQPTGKGQATTPVEDATPQPSEDVRPADTETNTTDQQPVVDKGPVEDMAATETKLDSSAASPGPPGLIDRHDEGTSVPEKFSAPSLLAELERFGDLLDDPTLAGEATEEEGIADVLTPGEVADDDTALPRPAMRDVDVAARLNDPLLGIELTDVSLSAFIRFVSDFSTISISFDPAALEQRQTSPRTTVSIRREETTIGQLLTDVLSSRGLEYIERDGQLIILAASPKADSWREVTHDVADLVSGSPNELKSIADGITALIEPKSWQKNGGPAILKTVGDSLVVRHDEAIHFQVLKLCEKLRVARGLSPQSSYPTKLFRLDTRATLAKDVLEQAVSMNYLDAARFVEILEQARRQTESNILVDWHALAEVGWNPDASFPYSVDAKPLRTMLDRLLTRMDLTYRIINEDTIQITTDARLLDLAEIEFYRVGHVLSDELTWQQLVAGIRATVGEVYFLDHAGAIHFDGQSKCLIVALPQPQQIVVAGILAGLEKSDATSE